MTCNTCKIIDRQRHEWQERAAKYAEEVRKLSVEKAVRDYELDSQRTANNMLTEEVERLKDYEWMYKGLCE